MMSRNSPEGGLRQSGRRAYGWWLAIIVAAGLLPPFLAGCEKKKKPLPPPPPAARVEETPPPVDVDALVQELRPDARVQFAASQAPADRSLAEAVVRLADALARGDAAALRGMVDASARQVLDRLLDEGYWSTETRRIEAVRVVYISDTTLARVESSRVGVAVQVPDGAFVLGWLAQRSGDTWTFSSVPTQDVERPRASDFDGQWLAVTIRPDAPLARGPDGRPHDARRPDQPAGEDPGRAPGTKSTPGGPITIPGPGGS